ncbi:SGNH/GDSL hydrolase family protein [Polymorphospora sp. NPDC050346]|uniref:SGNH/GDSL hydrolase family protein n=1 Tax=Polymorphospora sp. NPDC050346 TaxID=3155780 RepID=UPI0033DE37BD
MSFRDLERAHRNKRYELVPQFEQYDANELFLRPYVTFVSRPGIDNPVFRTDRLGYRLSDSGQGPVDSDRWRDLDGGIVLGGSFVFGVGASGDGTTLPSRLAHRSGVPYLNLGIYAGNSLQELVAAVPFLAAARSVLICSGINNVFASLQSLGHNEVYGPLFFEGALATLGRTPIVDLAAAVAEPGRGIPDQRAADTAGQVLPSTDTGDHLAARMTAALDRQLRDLRIIAGAARPDARVLFCLQPFADPVLRTPTPPERELFDLARERQGPWLTARDYVAANWDAYADRMAAGCAELGVDFVDLTARRFTGWSFYDRVHMTDHGYQQAADIIWERLCSTS